LELADPFIKMKSKRSHVSRLSHMNDIYGVGICYQAVRCNRYFEGGPVILVYDLLTIYRPTGGI
jgi:hypothetical protein